MDDIDRYLAEDLGEMGDITSDLLFTDEEGEGAVISKESCIVAGLEEAALVFKKLGVRTIQEATDGDLVDKGAVVLRMNGRLSSILKGERLALNFICRMSGIASETHSLVMICRRINPNVSIAATRKTTPGFRKYEKKAVVLGGGEAHRLGLYDMILVKDNHIKGVGSLKETLQRINEKKTGDLVEVEVETPEEAQVAARMNVDEIMLDNFDVPTARLTSKTIREINPHILIEISGGITKENIVQYAPFADRISLGALTHSVKSKDFSLDVTRI